MDILTQLNRAMTYIEEHIDDDMVLEDVASVTAYSPYHFGRLFYYTVIFARFSEHLIRSEKRTLLFTLHRRYAAL
jgi:AraC family transcriptional regulator